MHVRKRNPILWSTKEEWNIQCVPHTINLVPHIIGIDSYGLTMMALRQSDIWYMIFARRMTTNVGVESIQMLFWYWRFSFVKASVWCVHRYGIHRFEFIFDFWAHNSGNGWRKNISIFKQPKWNHIDILRSARTFFTPKTEF